MFVFVDIERIIVHDNIIIPTQLASIKCDNNFNCTDSFNMLIAPNNISTINWSNEAFNGASHEEFMLAPTIDEIKVQFNKWISDDDTICLWNDEDVAILKEFFPFNNKIISICKYVANYIDDGEHLAVGTPYELGKSRNIPMPKVEHCSYNDVVAMYNLMIANHFQLNLLLKPLATKTINYKYYCDDDNSIVHVRECCHISEKATLTKHRNLNYAFKNEYTPCDCCKKEYYEALKKKNIELLDIYHAKYVYSPVSMTIHLSTCIQSIYELKLLPTRYQNCIKMGVKPCPICEPDKMLEAGYANASSKAIEKRKSQNGFSEEKAIQRQSQAIIDRYNLTQIEKDNLKKIYEYTQPRYAFWSINGSQHFHLSNCEKLVNAKMIKGYSHYNEALSAGYLPCKFCNPTPQDDMDLSIPIFSKYKENETIQEIMELCNDFGFSYDYHGRFFYVYTPVGKWKIDTFSMPFSLQHINLARDPFNEKDYHIQPRLFLSKTDIIIYIKHHDDNIMKCIYSI